MIQLPLVSNPNHFCPCTYYMAIIHLSITYELDRIGGILWWHLGKNMGLFKNMKGSMLAILNSPLLLKLVFYWGCTVCPVVVFKATMVPSTSGEAKPGTTAEAWIPGDQTWDANGLVHDVEPERSCGLGMLGKGWGRFGDEGTCRWRRANIQFTRVTIFTKRDLQMIEAHWSITLIPYTWMSNGILENGLIPKIPALVTLPWKGSNRARWNIPLGKSHLWEGNELNE